MGSGDNKTEHPIESIDDQLAKDVARLYAWANIEGVPYRDFSYQRKQRQANLAAAAQASKTEEVPAVIEPAAPSPETIAATSVGTPPIETPPNAAPVIVEPEAVAPPLVLDPAPEPHPEVHREPVETVAVPQVTPSIPVPPPVEQAPVVQYGSISWEEPLPSGGRKPVLGIYSLAGGVGKTTLCANLGRLLCFQGERVLLVDASGSGLLPFYFGANNLRPGLRTFVDPEKKHLPVQVIGAAEETIAWLEKDVKAAMAGADRTIFDLGPALSPFNAEALSQSTEILIPLQPNPSSILTIGRMQSAFQRLRAEGHTIPEPYFVFNTFDATHPRDARAFELVKQQCGSRLLAQTIHYGPEMEEAIAARMTVADHAPESMVTRDLQALTLWLKKIAPVTHKADVARRWIEQ